jgi:hypothetical protein
MMFNRKIRAQSLVEFALILPFLFLLIMGLFDLGRGIFYYSVLNTAVREGTRFAIVQPHCDYKSDPGNCSGSEVDTYPLDCNDASSTANINICNEVRGKLFSIGDLSPSTITIDHLNVDGDDPMISIDITLLFHPTTPGIAMLGDLQLHTHSQMLMTPAAIP